MKTYPVSITITLSTLMEAKDDEELEAKLNDLYPAQVVSVWLANPNGNGEWDLDNSSIDYGNGYDSITDEELRAAGVVLDTSL